MPTVFISYANEDANVANRIARVLEDADISFFLDRKDVCWGDSILAEIDQGVLNCLALVVVISPASLNSKWVPFELGLAMGAGKPVLPFLTHPSIDVPSYLSGIHHISSIQKIREWAGDFTSQPFDSTTSRSSEMLSGRYLAFNWEKLLGTVSQNGKFSYTKSDVLVEYVQCFVRNGRITAVIDGVCRCEYDSSKHSATESEDLQYRLEGHVIGGSVIASYWSTAAESWGEGAIVLKPMYRNTLYIGRSAHADRFLVNSAPCVWYRQMERVSLERARNEVIEKAVSVLNTMFPAVSPPSSVEEPAFDFAIKRARSPLHDVWHLLSDYATKENA